MLIRKIWWENKYHFPKDKCYFEHRPRLKKKKEEYCSLPCKWNISAIGRTGIQSKESIPSHFFIYKKSTSSSFCHKR
jgi:hypothetical protein